MGLKSLHVSPALVAMAADHAKAMATYSVLAHDAPDGSLLARATRHHYEWSALEENVAEGQPDVPSVMQSWMASKGHRQNILNPAVTEMGGAVARSAHGDAFWCVVLGSPTR